MFACDLHTHTIRSDGHMTPIESIDRAASLGLKVMAITDHDMTLPAIWKGIDLVSYGAEKGIRLLPGIEVSCDTWNDDVHIIGLYCNWDDPAFADLEHGVQTSRMESYQEMIRKMAKAGYQVSWQEVLEHAGKTDCPETVQKKSVYELLAAKGYAVDWAKAKRLVQSVPKFQTNREKPDPVKIIQLLHKTGGIAIMAHPFLVKEHPPYQGKTMTRFQYMDMLVDAGLDGIEASYTYDKSSYAGRNSKAELEQQIRSRYQSKGIFFSGGSDFHGDQKTGIPNPRELGECGVTYQYYTQHIEKLRK